MSQGGPVSTTSSSDVIPVTPYVVTAGGTYTTIQSALDAANAAGGGTVYVTQGTWTEDLTLYDDVHIIGYSESATFIDGTHTPPSSGTVNIFRCTFQDASAIFSSAAAGSTELLIEDCTFTVTNGFTFDLANWTGTIALFDIGIEGTNDGTINNTGGATIFAIAASMGIGSGQTMITSGTVYMQEVDLSCPWNAQTGSDIECDYVTFTQPVTLSNNTTGIIDFCRFTTGASAAVTMSSTASVTITSSVIDSSNNPAIDGSGAGTLTLSDVTFLNNSSIAGTLTLSTTGGWYPPGDPGTSGQVLTSNGSGSVPTFQTLTPGILLQEVSTSSASVISVTTAFVFDDTVPQVSETDEIITLAITPTSASSILEITFSGWAASAGGGGALGLALFQDANTSALQAGITNNSAAAGQRALCNLTYLMTAGTASSTTFKIGAGTTGNTFYFNGTSGGVRILGGVSRVWLTIREYSS